MNVLDIYNKYKIPPQLQTHQLTVTAVAHQISDNFDGNLEKENIIQACLLHDMGNIIKFDLNKNLFNETEEELDKWRQVQKEFTKKYGNDEHEATNAIVSEIGVSEKVCDIVNSQGFSNACEIEENTSYEKKICEYSDMRVVPQGIQSLQERLSDLRERYEYKNSSDRFIIGRECVEKIEKQIFEYVKIEPNQISNDSTKEIIEKLKKYNFV